MKEYKFKIAGSEFNVVINGIEGDKASVTVNGVDYEVEIGSADTGVICTTDSSVAVSEKRTSGISETAVTSPLPGIIVEVSVKEGQGVKKGQKVAVLEAMKMENDILAPRDGIIGKVLVGKGDSVLEGAGIVTVC